VKPRWAKNTIFSFIRTGALKKYGFALQIPGNFSEEIAESRESTVAS
jgi:hypothetical protein